MKKLRVILALLLTSLNLYAVSVQIPITTPWKTFTNSDLIPVPPTAADFPELTYDFTTPGYLKVRSEKGFWLYNEIQIPSEYQTRDLYFETGRSSAAMEIYVDGVLVQTHGILFPKLHINHVSNTIAKIPEFAKKDGKVVIAIKCKTTVSDVDFSQFTFSNDERYVQVKTLQNFLNCTIYTMMAAICLFLGLYFFFQLFGNKKDKSSGYFSLALIAVSIYFWDMSTDILILPIHIQNTFARYCLLLSISGLVMFINSFFNRPAKLLFTIAVSINLIFLALYIYATTNSIFMNNLFTISLAPIFGGIIYLIVILVKNVKKKDKNAAVLLAGISFGLLFGIHDIIYQAMGKIPFAWLQGFAFFFINISMFVVVSLETFRNKQSINNFASTTSEQKERLDLIMAKARQLSIETMSISNTLNESVASVAQAVEESASKTDKIGEYINVQNQAVQNTASAIENLVSSVNSVIKEVNTEGEVVETTINETKMMIEGVGKVAKGIENAASFSSSLETITRKSSDDVGKLVLEIEAIKNSSAEIINIVKAVSDFSRRTNMLAMNASIEAAHSGVAGKGFSVIAHEIKKLAEASNAQSEKITEIVTQIDENITAGFELSKNIKKAMDNVSRDANTTSNTVNESVQGMEEQRIAGQRINDATVLMTESADNVKNETQRQNQFAQIVSMNMDDLSKSATNANSAVKEIIENNQELLHQTAAIRELAERTKDAASELDKLIRGE